MNNVIAYDFRGHAVRVLGTPDRPLFVATDVCRALSLNNASLAVNGNPTRGEAGLEADEKGVANVNTLGGKQNLLCVTESGLYALIFKSRKAKAREFRKWVTAEVLPSIRRTGAYDAKGQDMKGLLAALLTRVDRLERCVLQAKATGRVPGGRPRHYPLERYLEAFPADAVVRYSAAYRRFCEVVGYTSRGSFCEAVCQLRLNDQLLKTENGLYVRATQPQRKAEAS